MLDINFHNVRPYDSSRQTGFEELCSQLASLEPLPEGAEFFRKGRGADAGIECFVKHADGSETGWQAKWLFDWNTSLASQLDKSIRTALTKHPKLTKFVVCLPFDLPDSRKKGQKSALQKWEAWAAKWEATAAKENRSLKLELWGKSELSVRLTMDHPAYAGRLLYWFDVAHLTSGWFVEQFDKAKASLGSRYSPETNVELPIRQSFLGLARDPSLQVQIDEWLFQLVDAGRSAVAAVLRASKDRPIKHHDALKASVESIGGAFGGEPTPSNTPLNVDRLLAVVDDCANQARETLNWICEQKETEGGSMGVSPERWARENLFRFADLLGDVAVALRSDAWQRTNDAAVLLIGAAGIGKSHLLADIVEHQVHAGRPAILILGSSFNDDEPWHQIIKQLDLPPNTQTKTLLGALDAAAQASNVRALVCVDALNERRGTEIWPHRLAAFLKVAEAFPRVAVVLSCRTTYIAHVVPESLDASCLPRIRHEGFAENSGEAAKAYLDARGIVRPGTPNLVPEFNNPLFLKTCCDFLIKDGKTELPRGLHGVTAIFGFYTTAIVRTLNQRMGLVEAYQLLPKAITAFAAALAKTGDGYLPVSEAIDLFEAVLPSQGRLDRSLISQLENEGLLAVEPVLQDDDTTTMMVRFTFERISDHLVAKRLLDEHLNTTDVAKSFEVGTPLGEIVLGDHSYRFAGTIEAIAVQLPERTGVELPDVVTDSWTVREAFWDSLLWRDQSFFTQRTLEIAKSMRALSEVQGLLLALSTEPKNRFNALFMHERLMPLSLTERDRRWSIFVAEYQNQPESAANILIAWTLQNGMETIEDERAELVAITLTWFFTTTFRPIRDRATKALSALLANRLALASHTLRRFASVNDPYVLERLVSAAYGAALQGETTEGLPELAEAVFEVIFESGSPPPHALMREAAHGLLAYAETRGVGVGPERMAVATPPYRSAWPIEYVTDETVKSYTQPYGKGERYTDQIVSSTVNDGDFARYILDNLVSFFSPAPLGTNPLPSNRDLYDRWHNRFLSLASADQRRAFDELMANAKVVAGGSRYERTPEREQFNLAETAFKVQLTDDEWEEFRVTASAHAYWGQFSDWERTDDRAKFDTGWGRRWVCKRAHDLGWTPALFAHFDRSVGYDRHDHRTERIGKKYQWIALHELAARLSDNVVYIGGYSDFDEEENRGYGTARQVGLRDIDPSLLVTETHGDGWKEFPRTWWTPVEVRLRAFGPSQRRAWLDSDADIINEAGLIDVTDPQSKRRWLVLDNFSSWHQHGLDGERKEMQRDTWFRLTCVVVKKADESALLNDLSDTMLTSPEELPGLKIYGDQFLGEYPWHPSFTELGKWMEPGAWRSRAVPVRASVAEYYCERGGYDYSIEKSVSIHLPAPWLVNALKLRLANGRKLNFVDGKGRVQFFDPSVVQSGPRAGLVDRDAFLTALAREGLSAIWVIAGEKGIYGGGDSSQGFGGRVLHTGVYRLVDGEWDRRIYFEREDPSADQLKGFFHPDGVPEGLTVRADVLTGGLNRRKGREP
ncbi:hypothetical protein FKB34_14535 [Glycocaulis profundi]|nr:hypothetical protein FKB34_14535 [Glycocaulis profundi]